MEWEIFFVGIIFENLQFSYQTSKKKFCLHFKKQRLRYTSCILGHKVEQLSFQTVLAFIEFKRFGSVTSIEHLVFIVDFGLWCIAGGKFYLFGLFGDGNASIFIELNWSHG